MNRYARDIIIVVLLVLSGGGVRAQVNTDQVMRIGQNSLYFEDYMLSIQYFNQAIAAKPYLAQPYFYRAVAKFNLDDYMGAEADANRALELNPYLTDAYEVRGVARQNLGRLRAAIEDYDRALELLPRNRQLLFNKALAQTDADDHAAADSTYSLLLSQYPNFDKGYLGRASLRLVTADTVGASEDIDRALAIDRNNANAYIMRADIAINSHGDYNAALADIDEAIRLMPHVAGLYINRAFLRYNLDSYTGAMADYDYALTLDPLNATALFNRGLLLAEVSANDLALDDFNRVLSLDPDDYRALYNRAVIYKAKGEYDAALADMDRVAERFPDFPGAVYFRAAVNEERGNLAAAERDYRRARRMLAELRPDDADRTAEGTAPSDSIVTPGSDMPDELTGKRFATLLTVDDNAAIEREYNNSAIRGRVQDRDVNIELEPPMLLSFYSSPTELRGESTYIRQVEDINATRALRHVLLVTNKVPTLDEAASARHFQSIDYYNSYLATHTGRPIDYIGRALDFLTVRDYTNAERDATRALEAAPDLALAYMVRAQAKYGNYRLGRSDAGTDATTRGALATAALDDILADIDELIRLAPDMAVAWFNKGDILFERGDYAGADAAFSRAIELRHDFGEAYYNRGYLALRSGRRDRGIADLSKAGELGIVGAYNLIKRMSN